MIRRLVQSLAVGLIALACGCGAGSDSSFNDPGASATLTWNDVPSADGYHVYYGVMPKKYETDIDVGPNNSYVISGLQHQTTYYFAVTAYNDGGESEYSDEVAFQSR